MTTGAKTGLKNPRCYASALADCASEISAEHYVTHAVLRQIAPDGLITLEGFPWQRDRVKKKVPTQTLTGKVLCVRHNSALSSLDTIGKHFFKALDAVDREFRAAQPTASTQMFRGHDVERWMLKTLCGVVASGNAASDRGEILTSAIPAEWLAYIFGDEDLPVGLGWWYVAPLGQAQQPRA